MDYLETLETLLLEHGKLQAILESSINGIVEFDRNGTILMANPASKKILRLKTDAGDSYNVRNILASINIDDIIEKLLDDDVNLIKIETHIPLFDGSPDDVQIKYLEIKFLSLPKKDQKFMIMILTDKSDVVRAMENREHFIRTLIEIIEDLKIDNREVIYHLAKLVEIRDVGTGQHLERVEAFTRLIAREYQKRYQRFDDRLTDDYVEDMALSSVLHDIGKIGISDVILNKPGKLDSDEFRLIEEHTIIAGDALVKHRGKKDYLAMGREIALNHHEKWDGTGYPAGKSGEEIPLSGRIVALSDVYDALTSERSYKKAFSHSTAVEIITSERAKSFDPKIVDIFLDIQDEFEAVHLRHVK